MLFSQKKTNVRRARELTKSERSCEAELIQRVKMAHSLLHVIQKNVVFFYHLKLVWVVQHLARFPSGECLA